MRFSHSLRKLIAAATAGVTVLGIAASMSITMDAAAAPNLLPNPSFELGAADVTGSPQYLNPQPLLPQGWAFEGAAGLFDHSQNGSRSGRRMAAISIPFSGKRQVCDPNAMGICIPSPAQPIKDQARQYYSVNPAWRTLDPVNLTGAGSYTVSAWVSGELITAGEGPFVGVRWYNGNTPVGYSQVGPMSADLTWRELRGTVFPAPGANRAHVFLGTSDDIFISQTRFDDVCFGVC